MVDFDAGVALAVNLTVDALLIYFTGGSSILNDLQYLKHTTKIGRALAGGIESTEAVEIWRGFKGATDIFTLTAGSLTHINQYLITTENNEDKRKILEGCQKIFISLTFLGVGLSLTAQAHAVSEAGKVLDLIEALPSGVAHGLTPEMINLLTTLKGNKNVTLTLFGNKLNTLDLGDATNYIVLKYNSVLTDAQRLKFMTDFQHIDDLAFWRLLNNGRNASGIRDGSYLDNWILLSEKGLDEAKFTTYICNQTRKTALIRYTDQSSIKPVIKTLSFERKIAFLDTFGDVNTPNFAKFVNEPQLINYWKKYYDDLTLRPNFTSLSKEKQILWLEHYPDLSKNLINHLKTKSATFKNWGELSEADKLLLKNIPEQWIPSVHQYQDFCFIKKFSPIEIPNFVNDLKEELKRGGYLQVKFVWTDSNGFKISARVHQPIPQSAFFNDGQVWVINRIKNGSPNGSIRKVEEILLNDGTWFRYEDKTNPLSPNNWKGLINRQNANPPIITPQEAEILEKGHFKAK